MTPFKLPIVLMSCMFFAACAASSSALNKIHNGMTKTEVIEALGQPKSVSSNGAVEYMTYRYATSFADFDGSDTSDYFVRIRAGRVDAYGKKGDFNSTKNPTVDYNINQNVNTSHDPVKSVPDDDFYARLRKLQQLHDDKVITDEEFEKLKRQVIDSAK